METILTLGPDVFLWKNENKGLLYNARNHTSLEFGMTATVADLCTRLLNYDNLYSVPFDRDSSDSILRNLVDNIVELGMGCLHDKTDKIISLPPLLNILHDSDKLKRSSEGETQDFILLNLNTLVIYTGGSCNPNEYYLQTEYPVNTDKMVLGWREMKDFLESIDSPFLKEVKIVFSNIRDYEGLPELAAFLDTLQLSVEFYVCVEDYICVPQTYELLVAYPFEIKIIYTPGRKWPELPDNLEKEKLGFVFLVRSEDDCEQAESFALDRKLPDFDIVPIFNGTNRLFFQNNVLLCRQEILNSKLNRQAVFIHQSVNTNYFGRLIIMPGGKVYSNLACEPLGSMEDSIHKLIAEEMDKDYAWRKVRNTGRCVSCLYRYLCPSPTKYEELLETDCICTDV